MKRSNKNEKPPLAKNIIAGRKRLGFRSAESFAEHLGVPYPTLRDIEGGLSEGRPELRARIANALGCEIADLYADSDNNKLNPTLKAELHKIATAALEESLAGRMGSPKILDNQRSLMQLAHEKGEKIKGSFPLTEMALETSEISRVIAAYDELALVKERANAIPQDLLAAWGKATEQQRRAALEILRPTSLAEQSQLAQAAAERLQKRVATTQQPDQKSQRSKKLP